METCPKCHKEYTAPAWPWCPHQSGAAAVVADDIPGGQIFENGFDTPQIFYSHSAHRAALKARGLCIKAKWAGPDDKHLNRWDAPSAKSLEDARVLLSRGAEAQRARDARLAELNAAKADWPITVRPSTPEELNRS